MPNPPRGGGSDEIEHHGVVVFVGANGSGKTRLGAWLENPANLGTSRPGMAGIGPQNVRRAYRIGAQRNLSLPDRAERQDAEAANKNLSRGSAGPGGSETSRVSGDPVVGTTNDFNLLLNSLFAEKSFIEREYAELGRKTQGSPGIPKASTLERLQKLWESIFSERRLVVEDHLIGASPVSEKAMYPASKLSDGERVGFYLIGHALLAPKNSQIVVDEPELHLHPSIQSSIWNAIEADRKDCDFVYITHDLGFAASRAIATKAVLYDYTPGQNNADAGLWNWEVVTPSTVIPDDIALRILGSRKPTLFVEGKLGGLDQLLYSGIFPNHHIVPSGGWEVVDKSVRAFRSQYHLHHLVVQGLIDLDDRQEQEIESLRDKGIFVLPMATVENMLVCHESLVSFGDAIGLSPKESAEKVRNAKERVLELFKKHKESVISSRAQYAVRRKISTVSMSGKSKKDLVRATEAVFSVANPELCYDQAEQAVNRVLQAADVDQAFEIVLTVFRHKDVISQVASAFKKSPQIYVTNLLRILNEDGSQLAAQLRLRFPAGL